MKLIILTALYLFIAILSFLEILRGDFMDGVVGFLIAFGIYKFAKLISWKPRYAKDKDKHETKSEAKEEIRL